MKSQISGGYGRRMGEQDLPTSPTGMIFYRVVEDSFTDSHDIDRAIDVVIQTADPDDFADFDEALDEAIDRIQERIDLEERAERPDPAHLALPEEKLGDTGEALGAGWGEYSSVIPQPSVVVDDEEINLAEVGGRERFARLVWSGYSFDEAHVGVYEKLARQAECGNGAPRVRAKTLVPRPRPPLDLARVKIDPALAAAYSPAVIRGLLAEHKRLFASSPDWKPHRDGFVSDFGRPETSESHVHVLTVFLGEAGCITFAVVVPPGQLPPDDRSVMDAATIWLDGRTTPEMN